MNLYRQRERPGRDLLLVFVSVIRSAENVLVEEVRMNAEEMFEVFMLANGNAWANLVKEKFKLRQVVKFHVPILVDETMVESIT